MSVAAILMVKDEADIIEYTVGHLLAQVDAVYVVDNGSTDGTATKVFDLLDDYDNNVSFALDPVIAYYQSAKMTALAQEAYRDGHEWVVPCDADEFWYAPDKRPLREWVHGISPDVQIVKADLYNHLPTSEDKPVEEQPNPFLRIGWRQRSKAPLPKVMCRLRPDLVIDAGNHYARTSGTALAVGGLVIRHFSWRTEEQYLCKIRNGQEAMAATDLDEGTCAHWRMWEGHTDESIREHFRKWFFSTTPRDDESLMFDPAPGA